MKQQQLKFDLHPQSQRVVIEIQKSKYPDKKSQYEFYRAMQPNVFNKLKITVEGLKLKHKGYRFRIRKITYQTLVAEVVAKVEYLK